MEIVRHNRRNIFTGRSLFVGLNINSDSFEKFIKNFYLNLRGQGIDENRIPNIHSLHITLFQIHLRVPIIETDSFNNFAKTLKLCAEVLRSQSDVLKTKYMYYNHEYDTLKLSFDPQSEILLKEIHTHIINLFKGADLGILEEKYSFNPHITLIRSTNKYTPSQYDPEKQK